jgi:hypothetical protein
MEENKQTEITEKDKSKMTLLMGGLVLVGYLLGVSVASVSLAESYRKGVSDTLGSLVFRQ